MTHIRRAKRLWVLAAAVLASWVGATTASAERRAPYGIDSGLLETRVREDIERRINPLLEQMAPGQAELKYVDVRVTRPSSLPSGAAPGFEELTPGTEFVVERAEVQLVLDAKLPPPFRRDLKNLIKNRLEAVAVPIEIRESVFPFPTPRPQPTTREPLPYYPQMPQQPQQQAQPQATTPAAAAPTTPPAPPAPRGLPMPFAIGLAILALLIGALAVALVMVLRSRRRDGTDARGGQTPSSGQEPPAHRGATVDHLPEVRRALREDRVLARRVMGELLRENQLDKVALAVELVGPSVVEDLRGDPSCAGPLREAAALLVDGRAQGQKEVAEVVGHLHRRILKHRMIGAEDPVEQQFAFLQGLSAQRLAAVLTPESATVQAAALRYAPNHLRSAYLAERTPAERAALAGALAAPKSLSKEHMLDVGATLRERAAEQAHLDAGETGDIDLAVELIEERPPAEQAEILETMRRAESWQGARRAGRPHQRRVVPDRRRGRPGRGHERGPERRAGAVPAGRPGGARNPDRRGAAAECLGRPPRRAVSRHGDDPGPGGGCPPGPLLLATARAACAGVGVPGRRTGRRGRQRQGKGGGAVKPTTKVVGFAAALATAGVAAMATVAGTLPGCTVVTPGGGEDAGTKIIVIPIRPDALPAPKQVTASVLYVANLQRSSVNVADAYSRIILGITSFLNTKGVILENMGLISVYPDQFGSRLLLGRKVGAQQSSVSFVAALAAANAAGVTDFQGLLPFLGGALSNISDEDLPVALRFLAGSGRFDGSTATSEAKGLIDFGRNINSLALPPELGGIDRMALFDHPRDLFFVVYLQPLPRRCAIGSSACLVEGRDPARIFEETNSDGTASWLAFSGTGIAPARIAHVAIATSEGEDLNTFDKRCRDLPGFPPNLLDVISPSPAPYFGPLVDALNSAHRGTGHLGDFCALVGSDDAIRALGLKVAAFASGR